MKNLEQKMNELFQITSRIPKLSKDTQIKDELQLKDLNKAVNFISTKFDKYEKKKGKKTIN